MTPAELRAQFPALSSHVWLNAAAAAPLARPVAQAIRAFADGAEAHGDLGFRQWEATRERLRARLARLTGVAPAQVGLCGSTSHAMGIVARQLVAKGVREVVTLEGEFPSTTVPLLHAGLRLRVVPRGRDGGFEPEAIARAVTAQTGALAVSAVQFGSGYLVDLVALSALCRERGLSFVVNGAQALGQVPIDVTALGIDHLCSPSHKWLMGGWGVGVLVTRAPLARPALPEAGWLSLPEGSQWNGLSGAHLELTPTATVATGVGLREDAAVVEAGVPPFAAQAGLEAALALVEAVGVETMRAQVLTVQRALRTLLRAEGFVPTTHDEERTLSGICVVKVQGNPDDAVRALLGEGVVTTARAGGLRVSTHAFNTEADVEALGRALRAAGVRPA